MIRQKGQRMADSLKIQDKPDGSNAVDAIASIDLHGRSERETRRWCIRIVGVGSMNTEAGASLQYPR